MPDMYCLQTQSGHDEGILRSLEVVSHSSEALSSNAASSVVSTLRALDLAPPLTVEGPINAPIVTLERLKDTHYNPELFYDRAILDGKAYLLKTTGTTEGHWPLQCEVDCVQRVGAAGVEAGIFPPARVFEREWAYGYKETLVAFEDWGERLRTFARLNKEQAWNLYLKLETLHLSYHLNIGSLTTSDVLFQPSTGDTRIFNFTRAHLQHNCRGRDRCGELVLARRFLGIKKLPDYVVPDKETLETWEREDREEDERLTEILGYAPPPRPYRRYQEGDSRPPSPFQ